MLKLAFRQWLCGLVLISTATASQAAIVFVGEDDGGNGVAVHRWAISGVGDSTGSGHVVVSSTRPSGFAFSSALVPDELFMGTIQAGGGSGPDIRRSTNAFGPAPTFDSSRQITSPIGAAAFGDPINSPVNVGDGSGDLYVAGAGIAGGGQRLVRLTPTATGATVDYSLATAVGPNRGLTVSPWGEIFYSDFSFNRIVRYIDTGSGFTENTAFNILSGVNNPHGLAFRGNELFVANGTGNTISRFTFSSASTTGAATAGTAISGNGLTGPLGVAISPWGELWATNSGIADRISRFTFAAGEGSLVTSNGTFAFDDVGSSHFGSLAIIFSAIPEPSSFVMAMLGAGGLCLARRRRR